MGQTDYAHISTVCTVTAVIVNRKMKCLGAKIHILSITPSLICLNRYPYVLKRATHLRILQYNRHYFQFGPILQPWWFLLMDGQGHVLPFVKYNYLKHTFHSCAPIYCHSSFEPCL